MSYFGSTQGVLHVDKVADYSETTDSDGNVTNNGGGKEVFAFVLHEMLEKQSMMLQVGIGQFKL
jgi:type IV pilus assembly protein PilY1